MSSPVRDFITHHYRHFNSAALVDAAKGYEAIWPTRQNVCDAGRGHEHGGTRPFARRDDPQDKVHAICCTGANLEEDVFNLVAMITTSACRITRPDTRRRGGAAVAPHESRHGHLHPEMEAMRRIETAVLEEWVRADKANERFFPHQFMYKILESAC